MDRDIGDQLDVSAQESGRTGGFIADGPEDDVLDIRFPFPVLFVGFHSDMVFLHPFHHLIGTGTDGLQVHLFFSNSLHIFFVDDHDLGKEFEQGRKRCFRFQFDGVVVDFFDGVHELDHAGTNFTVRTMLERKYYIICRKRIPIMEFHAFPQMEDPGLFIFLFPGFSQGRLNAQIPFPEYQGIIDIGIDTVGRALIVSVRIQEQRIRTLGNDNLAFFFCWTCCCFATTSGKQKSACHEQ